jgi:hypothetical protein
MIAFQDRFEVMENKYSIMYLDTPEAITSMTCSIHIDFVGDEMRLCCRAAHYRRSGWQLSLRVTANGTVLGNRPHLAKSDIFESYRSGCNKVGLPTHRNMTGWHDCNTTGSFSTDAESASLFVASTCRRVWRLFGLHPGDGGQRVTLSPRDSWATTRNLLF